MNAKVLQTRKAGKVTLVTYRGVLQGKVKPTIDESTGVKLEGFKAFHESGLESKFYFGEEKAVALLCDYYDWRTRVYGEGDPKKAFLMTKDGKKLLRGLPGKPSVQPEPKAKARKPRAKKEKAVEQALTAPALAPEQHEAALAESMAA